ncbi:MAG: hypothetical protein UV20_C0009G0027 [Candidatus Magasanikbacteria bacterium GW2011_GWA2_42_32]|uniref:Uncharacterized protein n=1 Tax=Candidatus Magasanikbacteria bacterium GW2011_GWA2_42_32 TaxID=1619039 RepID=A0A0G1D3H0_9BACT|nr:MAG: hypothetical protein UV20_C0009G0027 [Candidatus Magasanikbacteria bacterium GW2011_GWA2_42_32]HBX15898.1 hypothetical protein [Candidatus Magasanikbacteria bacterium]
MDYSELMRLTTENAKHITVLNDDFTALTKNYTGIAIDVAVLKSQVSDFIWWFRSIAGAFIILIVSQAWQIILLRKK